MTNRTICDIIKLTGSDILKVNKTREVEPLKDLDEQTYLKAVANKELDKYENEIALTQSALTIPHEIMELPKQAQYMLSFYNDRQWINKETGKKTYNDIVECYIASLEDSKWVEDIFEKFPAYNGDGKEIGYTTIVKPDCKPQYMMLKQKAISYWNEKNLVSVVDIYKKLMLGGRKQEDMLRDEIMENALHNEDDKIKLRYVKHAIDITGMNKNVALQGMDVWLKGGGKEFGEHMAKSYGIGNADNSKYLGEEDVS